MVQFATARLVEGEVPPEPLWFSSERGLAKRRERPKIIMTCRQDKLPLTISWRNCKFVVVRV